MQLRRRMGLNAEMLAPYEDAAMQNFKNHQTAYQSAFSETIHQFGLIDSTTRQKLLESQKNFQLSDEAITTFETEIIKNIIKIDNAIRIGFLLKFISSFQFLLKHASNSRNYSKAWG
ncbi:MAG: hypothetical protein HC936_07205 [Leptolyngbyaceae cyanobacterium SU_3_3]|nr:hypothetical protein [Leptolyngbyaceae cyanobacterium SU_3_3]